MIRVGVLVTVVDFSVVAVVYVFIVKVVIAC
jgi:hypothetical protein